MGSLLSRALLLAFGYAYPAYKCFKIVEMKTPQIDQLLFWCRYWIIVAFVTALERIGDVSLSWLPLYGAAKLAFFIYLWHQETKGTVYIYNRFFRDYLAKHETEIDRKLVEIKTMSMNIVVLLWQKVIGYGLIQFYGICQCFSSQLLTEQDKGQEYLNNSEEKEITRIGPENGPKSNEASDTLEGNRTNVASHDSSVLPKGEETAVEHSRWRALRKLKWRMSCSGNRNIKIMSWF